MLLELLNLLHALIGAPNYAYRSAMGMFADAGCHQTCYYWLYILLEGYRN
jgi:hypothetical protein